MDATDVMLRLVMTAAEVEEEFHLGHGTVGKAAAAGRVRGRYVQTKQGKRSGRGTWLIARSDAECLWGKK